MVVDADSGEVVAVQIVNDTLKDISARLSLLLRHLPWQAPINATGNESRASGIVITHHTFGFTPPVPIRRRFGCSKSALNASHPDVIDVLDEFSSYAMAEFEGQLPDEAARTVQAVEALVPEAWRMKGSPWTSGIINNTASLPYHKDSGNVVGSWSAMLGSRSDVSGGYLHLFDYDCYFAVPDGSLSLFDGQGVVHGVTPMRAESFDAYRYTTVCYAKRSMSKCSPDPADEPLRAQKAATEAQERQLAKLLNRNDAPDAAS
jgi:hypothetical protein